MKRTFFFLILILPVLVLSQQVVPTSTNNYTHKIVYKKGFTESNIDQAANGDKIESIQYYDGLGRPIQSVGVKQGGKDNLGNDTDIITHIEYDAYGRQVKDYLPVPGSNNNGKFIDIDVQTDIKNYYFNTYTGEWTSNTEANPYSEKQFENSPLNRVLKQAAPGEDWKLGNGHEIEFDYQTNITGEVKLYTVTLTSDYTPTLEGGTATYNAGELYKNVTRDENHSSGTNHTTEEFKDKQGRVVLKRTYADINGTSEKHDTYYVYDDYGNLTYVLPPKSEADEDKPSSAELSELCYQYKYDNRNRLIDKKIPGKGWEYIVYNKLDQPVMTQDANLKSQNQWLFTKYDAFGRIVYTGIKNVPDSTFNQSYFQNMINNSTATQYEAKKSSPLTLAGTTIYYSSDAIPTSVNEILTINYYDNYTFNLPTGLASTVTTSYGVTSTTNIKGLSTGSKVKVLGNSSWITTITYYDEHKRPIYVYSKNDYLGTTDIVESKYIEYTGDIRGLVHETKTTHKKTGKTDIVTIDKFTYDHTGRMLSQTQNINNQGEESIAVNEYDDLGQLKRKKVGGTTNNELQIVDYTYNIRGWLKQINDVNNLGTTDLFAFKINYNDIANVNKRLYNGNISQTYWRTANQDNSLKDYEYSYDALNRITSGIFTNNNDSSKNNQYNLKLVEYDKNGNIKRLRRSGYTDTGYDEWLDQMVYTYDNGNKLVDILEQGNHHYGFADKSNTQTGDYFYDANGNMTKDLNKGIGTSSTNGITYNYLNLPTEIKFDNSSTKKINYTYDATGVKLQKVVNDGGNLTTTDYVGNYVYENGTLQFFGTDEGYVTPDGSGGFNYVYSYLDHLGNVRLNYSDLDNNGSISTSEILQENNYYPMGLKHKGYNTNIISEHKWKYNGKELQDELDLNWYDLGARNLDHALGRFMNVDPKAEQYNFQSPYAFANNNPVLFVDINGEGVDDIIINGKDENGNKVELARVITKLIEVEYNTDITVKSDMSPVFTIDATTTDLNLEGVLPDAFALNLTAEAAYKLGVQGEASFMGVLKGSEAGSWGVSVTSNALAGIEGGITGSASFYYSSLPTGELGLDNLVGTEVGVQGDVFSFSASGFKGVSTEFQNPIYRNKSGNFGLRSPIIVNEVYKGFSLGVTGGVLPASGSIYAGYSGYIYSSKKGWFPSD